MNSMQRGLTPINLIAASPIDRQQCCVAAQNEFAKLDDTILDEFNSLNLDMSQAGLTLVGASCVDAMNAVFICIGRSNEEGGRTVTQAKLLVGLGDMLMQRQAAQIDCFPSANALISPATTERMSQLADKIDCIKGKHSDSPHSPPALFALEDDTSGTTPSAVLPSAAACETGRTANYAQRPLPDAAMLRRMIRHRHQRARFFEPALFADPAWDIMLDLYAAQKEQTRVSITSLCIASGIPSTTALRWIGQMIEAGLLVRNEDISDRRRTFVTLSDKGLHSMESYFNHLHASGTYMI